MTTRDEIERAIDHLTEMARAVGISVDYGYGDGDGDLADMAEAKDRLLALLSPARPNGEVTISEAMVEAGARAAWIAEVGFDRTAPTRSEWAFCLDQARVILNAALDAAASDDGQEG